MGKPNVMVICVDEWAANKMGCSGDTNVMTPTLDYLAKNGIRLANAYSECPVCIPARRSLMTGLTPRSHGDRVYSDRMPMPSVPTLAACFHEAGYQTMAVGKLHVYPQRNRIGFDDVILTEEGRYDFGVVDDYQIWLGEQGYVGQEFMHAMGNNVYYTRPWHLPENTHPTNWVTWQMAKQIKRRDPTRPFFFFCSYQFPHPPLVPALTYWDMYKDRQLGGVLADDWHKDRFVDNALADAAHLYSDWEKDRARKAYYAQCTHIDYSVRTLIGTLRESGLLDNTILVFVADHGDMLFDHGFVAKRLFYESSANIPVLFSGKPMEKYMGKGYEQRLFCLADFMPTLLDLAGIPIPETVEGRSLFGESEAKLLFGEISEGDKATRMIRTKDYKLIYYPCGNIVQLFDMRVDRQEAHDLADKPEYRETRDALEAELVKRMYGCDTAWIKDGKLVGYPDKPYIPKRDFALYNQRGYHWPTPAGYSNVGANA